MAKKTDFERCRPEASTPGSNAQHIRFKQLYSVNFWEELARLLYDNKATFCDKQEKALGYITKGYDTLVVIDIGAGKSLLFVLPVSCVNRGTIIVIVPFKAL